MQKEERHGTTVAFTATSAVAMSSCTGLLYWAAVARGSPVVVALTAEEKEHTDGGSGQCGSALASRQRRRRARPSAATGSIRRPRGVTPSSSPPPYPPCSPPCCSPHAPLPRSLTGGQPMGARVGAPSLPRARQVGVRFGRGGTRSSEGEADRCGRETHEATRRQVEMQIGFEGGGAARGSWRCGAVGGSAGVADGGGERWSEFKNRS
jgi:hypothetical protein